MELELTHVLSSYSWWDICCKWLSIFTRCKTNVQEYLLSSLLIIIPVHKRIIYTRKNHWHLVFGEKLKQIIVTFFKHTATFSSALNNLTLFWKKTLLVKHHLHGSVRIELLPFRLVSKITLNFLLQSNDSLSEMCYSNHRNGGKLSFVYDGLSLKKATRLYRGFCNRS